MLFTDDLQTRITRIYDHLYGNGSSRTPAGIAFEVGKLLHTGMYVEEARKRVPAFQLDKQQQSQLLNNGSRFRGPFADQFREEFRQMNLAWTFYDKDSTISMDDFDICFVASALSGLVISDRDRDVYGDALEIIRSQWAKRIGGQFFTDQRVTSLAMKLMEYSPLKGESLVDLCAGSGGFLIAGLNHARKQLESTNKLKSIEKGLADIVSRQLYGFEVDASIADAANATLRARVGSLSRPIVSVVDSLSQRFTAILNDLPVNGFFSCAASNPPFGTKITVKDSETLAYYELARRDQRVMSHLATFETLSPRAPDVLFVERNLSIVEPGYGRVAIVLPYQILSGPDMLFVRHFILRHAQLQAVVDLPAETFQPHTGTKTALVVMKRRSQPLVDIKKGENYPTFMSRPRWIGHDRRGNTVCKRTPDGKATSQVLTDFPEVESAFDAFRNGSDPNQAHADSFATSYESILADPMLRINALYHVHERETLTRKSTSKSSRNWRHVKLRELVKDIFFPTRFKRNYVDEGEGSIRFLGGSNITEFVTTADKWLSPEDSKTKGLLVREGWILVTRSGTTGLIATVPRAWDGYAMSEHIIRIVPDEAKMSPYYISTFLRSSYAQRKIAQGVFGSVIDEITPSQIGNIDVAIPANSKTLEKVTELATTAEKARQVALEQSLSAVSSLDKLLAEL